MNLEPHFIAELVYRKSEDGGRKTAAQNGYRPGIKFDFMENQFSGIQKFIGKDSVLPGEKVMGEITLVSPQFLEGKMEIGMEFTFNEGANIIGTGKVTEILCGDLKASS